MNRFSWVGYFSSDIDNTFIWDIRHVGDHLLGGGLGFESTGLESKEVFSEDNEAIIAFSSNVVNSGSDEYFLSFFGLIDLFDWSPYPFCSVEGANEGVVSVLIFVEVCDFDLFVGFHELVLKI